MATAEIKEKLSEAKAARKSAKTWCEKARNLLRIKTKSILKKDEKTQDSRALTDAIKSVEKSLTALEKLAAKNKKLNSEEHFEEYTSLAEKYKEISKLAETAIEDQNKNMAVSVTASLQHLDKEIQFATGSSKITQEELDESRKNKVDTLRVKYDDALAAALEKEDALKSLAEGSHSFVGSVSKIIIDSELLLSIAISDPDHFTHAIEQLGKVDAECEKQKGIHAQYLNYKQEKAKAEQAAEQATWANSSATSWASSELAAEIRATIDEAAKLADRDSDYVTAEKKAKEAQKKFATGLKRLPKHEQGVIAGLIKAKKAYIEARKSAIDSLNEARALRGATTDSKVMSYIEIIEKNIKRANGEVETANKVEQVDKARQSLQIIAEPLKKAKEASQAVKKAEDENLKSAKKWSEFSIKATEAHKEMLTFQGVDEKQVAFSSALREARKLAEDQYYVDACEKIANYEQWLTEARTASHLILMDGLPTDIQTVATNARQACQDYQVVGQTFQSQANLHRLNEIETEIKIALNAANKGSGNLSEVRDASSKRLEEFRSSLIADIERLKTLRAQAEKKQNKFDDVITKLATLQLPESFGSDMRRLGDQAKNEYMVQRDWTLADERFGTAIQRLDTLAQQHEKFGSAWKQCEEKIKEIREFLNSFDQWQYLSDDRRDLHASMRDAEQIRADTDDLDQSIKAYVNAKIESNYEKLKQAYGSTDLNTLDAYLKTLQQANIDVDNASRSFFSDLAAITSRLSGVVDTNTEFEKRKDEIWSQWRSFYATAVAADGTSLDLDSIEAKKSDAIKQYLRLKTDIRATLDDSDKLDRLIKEVEATDLKDNADKLPAKIRGVIDMIEVFGQDLSAKRSELDGLAEQEPVPVEKLKALYDELSKELKLAQAEQQEKVEAAKKSLKENAKSIKSTKGVDSKFQAYHDKLVAQIDDIQAMIDSGDPYLLDIAVQQQRDLVKDHKAMTAKDAYKGVEDLIDQLAKDCGNDDVMKYLPDTYKRNHDLLLSTITRARASNPDEASKIMDDKDLRDAIAKAVTEAAREKERHREFKKRRKGLEDRWSKVKKAANIGLFDSTTACEKYLSSRLEEADSVCKGEGYLPQANEILDKVEAIISDILTDEGNAEQKLKEYHVKYEQEARRVRDLARQFQAQKDAFKNVTLKNALDKMKQEDSENIETLRSLEKVVDTASKQVGPYLKTIQTISIGADSAPNLEKAESQFAAARGQIVRAEQTVRRLLDPNISTNVVITEDFTKVQKVWQEHTRLYTAEVNNLLAAIKDISNEQLPEKDSKQCVQTLEKLSTHFRSEAFAEPFGVLMQPPAEKKDRAKQQKQKLAARERALATMRELRGGLLNHPTLRTLSAASENTVNGQEMLAVSGYIRSALKRIEIETLIGV